MMCVPIPATQPIQSLMPALTCTGRFSYQKIKKIINRKHKQAQMNNMNHI